MACGKISLVHLFILTTKAGIQQRKRLEKMGQCPLVVVPRLPLGVVVGVVVEVQRPVREPPRPKLFQKKRPRRVAESKPSQTKNQT